MSNDIDAPPPSYYRPRHWKYFAKKSAAGVACAIFGVGIIVATSITAATTDFTGMLTGIGVVFGLMVAFIGVFLVYRRYWQWQNSPIEGNAETGQVRIHHAESRWLFLRGSAPDQYELNVFSLVTPRKTWWELYVFRNSQLLHLTRTGDEEPVKLPDVVNVEELLAIDAYWSSLSKADINQLEVQQDILAELKTNNGLLQTNNELLRKLLGVALTIAPAREAPTESKQDTQELPEVGAEEEPNS